eukprot:9010456-Alexandrium_andersonii.AAC.1
MSASLVGSEMCIRDSAEGLPAAQEGHACPIDLHELPDLGRHVDQVAVSYTHLTLPTICSV